MEFLRFLESIRTPVGDALMSFITLFGEETLFMVLALVFFWCIDKRRGYYLLFTGFTGLIGVQILKMSFHKCTDFHSINIISAFATVDFTNNQFL